VPPRSLAEPLPHNGPLAAVADMPPAVQLRFVWNILKSAVVDFSRHAASRLGASLAFYSILSLAPLLVLTVAIGGAFLNEYDIRERLIEELERTVGRQGSEALADMLTTKHAAGGTWATILSIGTLLYGASNVFAELQHAMNTIWGVQTKPDTSWREFVRDRFFSFLLVLGTGFLLLVSLVVSAMVAGAGDYLVERWPILQPFGELPTALLTFAVVTFLFAMMFKVLPDVNVPWRDVWLGAIITSILFSLGKFFIGLYLGRSSYASAYGAAGSLVVLIVWIYYSSQILFFGAELTQVYSRMRRSLVTPRKHAVARSAEARERAGEDPSSPPRIP